MAALPKTYSTPFLQIKNILFDLQDEADLARLENASFALGGLTGLVVIDEVQRRPDLFPTLRVLIDRPDSRAQFLILGSASPDLLRQSSETLAGRIATIELSGFSLPEVRTGDIGNSFSGDIGYT